MAIKSIPDGYRSVTPYLIVADAAGAITFYQNVWRRKRSAAAPLPWQNLPNNERGRGA